MLSPTLASASFWELPAAYADRPAVRVGSRTLTYGELGARVDALAARLGPTRRLVALEGRNTLDALVGYLAALRGGHPLILVPDASAVAAYDPDVVLAAGDVHERRRGTAHELHPDLALLLSTSGTTGSPKLVRLSHDNLRSNTAAIASYLAIRPDDCAPTTLPMPYCYGLSVINSHLAVGACLLLTEASVTEAAFWDAFADAGCTTLAGVPFTFDLLDRSGFADRELPSLRYLTQAGGRLAPETVRRYAELGRRRGFDLVVMYGQTEATARMAYLPADLALSCPEAVGVPVPGGSFRLAEDGELVYRGDNVMLGYATSPADLARGREVTELRTGDLARLRPDGLYEITGRTSRFAKVFGLRVDLDRLEQLVAAEGVVVSCADGGDRVVVALDTGARPEPAGLPDLVAGLARLPLSAVQVLALPEMPRLPNGKPDLRGVVALADARRAETQAVVRVDDLCAVFADVLRREVGPDDTFVGLGGDSLSYVEMSVRLESALGTLPTDWPTTPVGELAGVVRDRRPGRLVETNVLLRAGAIVAIVGSHAGLFTLLGGAHVLLAVAGYNLARFFLTDHDRDERASRLQAAIVRVVLPCVAWLASVVAFDPDVTWRNVLLLNGVLGPEAWDDASWHYWFIEAVVALMLVMLVLVRLPLFDRLERRWPFGVPIALACVALLTRYDVVTLRGGDEIHRAHIVFWLFALGWAAARATGHGQRLMVSVLTAATLPGFFAQDHRVVVVVVGMLLLVWLPAVRLPAVLAPVVGALAGASLWIYLVHWQIYPALEDAGHSLAATVLSLGAGLVMWHLVGRAVPRVAVSVMGNNRRWLSHRRYSLDVIRRHVRAADRPRRDDQPAHLAA